MEPTIAFPVKTVKYKNELPLNLLDGPPYPTNSWANNVIQADLASSQRVVNITPWYLIPSYSDSTMYYSHTTSIPLTTQCINKNILIQEAPNKTLSLGCLSPTNLTVTNLDEMTMTILQTCNSGMCTHHIQRGSPWATAVFDNSPVLIDILSGNIINLETVDNGYQITTNPSWVSSYVETMLQTTPGTWVSQNAFVYQGLEPNPTQPVAATYDGNVVTVTFMGETLNTGQSSSSLPSGVIIIGSQTKPNPLGFQFTNDSTVTTITVNTNTNQLTISNSVIIKTSWLVMTTANLVESPAKTSLMTTDNYTGIVQIAFLGIDSSQFSLITDALSTTVGNYATSGVVQDFDSTGGLVTYNVIWGANSFPLAWLYPDHYKSLNMSGIGMLSSPGNGAIYHTLQYGLLNLGQIIMGMTTFSSNIQLPDWPDLSSFTSGELANLSKQVQTDAAYISIDTAANPYTYGQQAFRAARVIALADALGILNNVNSLIQTLRTSLISWMEGTNSDSNTYQLQYDSTWGGVIVPADIVNENNNGAGPTAFGNSFYNDHHFHYGYFYYSLALLEKIGQGLSISYSIQINNLLYDVINPVINPKFSWRLRQKDWYSGHSWASGVQGNVNRQEESSGEAINAYFSGYLLAQQLGNTTVQYAAMAALVTEIFSTHSYFGYQANGTPVGNLTDTGGLGQITIEGPFYTLDWQMQPATFPGRVLGIYGIQSLPYTDISKLSVLNTIVNQMINADDCYAMTVNLVIGLTDNSYTPAPNQLPDTFDPLTEGNYWGNVGTILLSASDQVTPENIQTMWNNMISKQTMAGGGLSLLRDFDSYSNTMWWLICQGKLTTLTGTQSIAFNLQPTGPTDITHIKTINNNNHMIQHNLPNVNNKVQQKNERPRVRSSPYDKRNDNSSKQENYGYPNLGFSQSNTKISKDVSDDFAQDDWHDMYNFSRSTRNSISNIFAFIDLTSNHKDATQVRAGLNRNKIDFTVKVNYNNLIKGNDRHELGEKSLLFGLTTTELLTYAATKTMLAMYVYGEYQDRYLSRSFHPTFLNDLAKSSFSQYTSYFNDVNHHRFFI